MFDYLLLFITIKNNKKNGDIMGMLGNCFFRIIYVFHNKKHRKYV